MRIGAMKKQSQNKPNLRKAKMAVNFYSTKDYENKPRLRAPGKQTQFKPNLRKARMKLNFYSTNLYENQLADNPQKANNNPTGKKRIIKGDKK